MRTFATLGGMLLLLSAGCVSAKKAFPLAAHRSGCKPDRIEVVKQDGHDTTLNVCGVYEDWHWHALSGWEYVGPSSEQPLEQTMDRDMDGVPDDVDACPDVAGLAALEPVKNGCPVGSDGDGDGVSDVDDACPAELGIEQADPKKNGCPPDADGDGVADSKDACPDKPGVASETASHNGCPPDADGDGVADAEDQCPNQAGVAAHKGCPADRDGDGVLDAADACPDQAGVPSELPEKSGCPADEAADAEGAKKAPN
jgi:hypothetical protein